MTSYPSLEVLIRPGRKRRFGPKVRTGCITCRQRRVKCDEAKPACEKCTKFGRLCDGYTQPLELPLSSYEPQNKPAPSSVTPTYKDRQIFNLLRTVTVRQIAAGINTEFWSINVLQAATINPAIWHASLALSAMHQRMMMTAGKINNTPYLAQDYLQFAIAQYNTSSHYTRQLMQRSTLSLTEKEELLMTGVLYAGISFLQRNMPVAILHAQHTLRIYHSWRFWEYLKDPPTKNARTVIGTRHILHLASDIYFALRAFGVPIPDEVGDQFTKTVEASDEPFESITEAYYEYLPILRAQIKGTACQEDGQEILPSESTIQLRKRAFEYWDRRFDAFTHTPAYQQADPDTIQTIKLLRSVEEVFAAVSLDRTPATWARFYYRWRQIIDEAEELLLRLQQANNPGGFLPRFTYSLSLLEVFRLVGLLSRDNQLRFRIIEILKNWPLRDGLLDSQIVLTNIETKMTVENHAFLESAGSCECVSNVFVCADHRVSRFVTEIPDETSVIYHVQTGLDFRQNRPSRRFIYPLH